MTAAGSISSPGPEKTWVALWAPCLAAFVALRILVPLTALAAAPDRMPLLPRYDGIHLNGDAPGYYQAVSALFASFAETFVGVGGVVLAAAVPASVVAGVWAWHRGQRAIALLVPAVVVSVGLTVLAHGTAAPGAPVVGWPLVWALALSPLPVLGLELTPDRAFAVGVGIGLVANAVTTVATAYLGFAATGRRSVGLLAAGVFATWPLWVGVVASRAWENSQWDVDAGIHLYTEPLSTMLVIVSLAMLLRTPPGEAATTASGLALGLATVVKLTNGLIGLVLVPLVAVRYGIRRAAALAVGGIICLPIVIAWWPKGYVQIYDGSIAPIPAYSLDYIEPNWQTSTIFTPLLLVLLVVPALVGIAAVRGWYARSVLVAPIIVTVVAYSAYYVTYQHPRFLYVALPPLFVLDAAGISAVLRGLPGRSGLR